MSAKTSFRVAAVAAALASAAVLSACSPGSDAPSESPSASVSGELQTLTPGKLTIATGEPAYEPWVLDDDPSSGKGFESAVAYAVADQLGFDADDVVWVRTSFDSAITPGPKTFDFNLQQFSITEERKQAVDFSSPYYVSSQAVITTDSSDIADATTTAELKDVSIGVAVGTTSLDAVNDVIQPSTDPQVFNSNEDAVTALKSGQIEAIVTDLPTALYLSAAEIDGGKIVGQLASTEGGDEYGLLLAKDSPLTEPVTAAVDALREDGTLDQLADEWLADYANAPVLK